MYSKILVANDGSAGGQKAFTAGIELAQKVSAELHMVIVEELPRFPATAEAAGLTIETHLLPGHVVDTVIGLIKQLNIDLLVVGFMGHSQLYERIIGSTTDRLVRLASCAVLVVK